MKNEDANARFEVVKAALKKNNGPQGQLFTEFTSWPGALLEETNRASEGAVRKSTCK